jgi:hypothetical protein
VIQQGRQRMTSEYVALTDKELSAIAEETLLELDREEAARVEPPQ